MKFSIKVLKTSGLVLEKVLKKVLSFDSQEAVQGRGVGIAHVCQADLCHTSS